MRFADGFGSRPFPRPRLIAYFMVDRARLAGIARLAEAARAAGATALELGFPFSDPIADGPVLQGAADRALRHRTGWNDLLRSVAAVGPILPTAVMTYANPVFRRGVSRATAELSDAGAAGLIVPDLPFEESGPWSEAARSRGLDLILLSAPGADPRRARALARSTSGFLYLVSRYGTTGPAGRMASGLEGIVRTVHRTVPHLPVIVGFGVRDRETTLRAVRTGADGVVVASALETALQGASRPEVVSQVLAPVRRALEE